MNEQNENTNNCSKSEPLRRVIVSGSTKWKNTTVIRKYLKQLDPDKTIIIHGNSPGAESIVNLETQKLNFIRMEVYPAQWNVHDNCHCEEKAKYCAQAGPRRNQQMIDQGVDYIIVFYNPKAHENTDDIVIRAMQNKIPIEIITR